MIGAKVYCVDFVLKELQTMLFIWQIAKQSIQVYKQVSEQNKQSISNLERTYTQANCLLAET